LILLRSSGRAVALLLLLAVACRGKRVPEESDPASRSTGTTPAADAASGSGAGVRIVAAPPGEVATLVREALSRAAAEHRRLLVYVGATWCEPCRRFHEAALRGELDASFGGLTLLEFDLDRDGERLKAARYESGYIPLFAVPAPDGTASGRQLEGAVKGDGAVGYIAARLPALLGS
jgi:hypothetical protein